MINDNDNLINNDNDDNADTISDYNLAIGELLPIVSLKRRLATPNQVLNNDNKNDTAIIDSIVAAVTSTATTTATATSTLRTTQLQSITPNLFLTILVPDKEQRRNGR